MTEELARLVAKHQSRGILVDSNILLLYFVGQFDRQLIPRFKRTAQFVIEDFDLLRGLLSCFRLIVTTPHILSEINSLSGQLGEPARTKYFGLFADRIGVLDEHYVASHTAAEVGEFPRLGLTDSGIIHLAGKEYLVLTDDLQLAITLERKGTDVLNFNHLRPMAWN